MHRFKMIFRLLKWLKPVFPIMIFSITIGFMGHLFALFLMAGSAVLLVDFMPDFTVGIDRNLLIGGVILCGSLRGLFRYIEQLAGHDVAFRLLAQMRSDIFKNLRRLSPAKLDDRKSGDILSAIMGDIEYIEVFFAHTVAPVVIAVLFTVSVYIFLGHFSGLIVLILLPFHILIGAVVPVVNYRMGKGIGTEYRTKLSETNSYFLESIRGLREILLYNQGENRRKDIHDKGTELARLTSALKKKEYIISGITDIAVYGSALSILAFLYGGNLQSASLLVTGIIITVTALSSFGPLVALSHLSTDLIQTFAAVKRVFALMDEKPFVENLPQDELTSVPQKIDTVSYEKVSFSYPTGEHSRMILSDFNLSIKNGEKIAIIGESGIGKSTVIKLLLRFYNASNGTIKINDTDIRRLDLKDLRAIFSYMEQDTFLFSETVEYNLKMSNTGITDDEMIRACKMAEIHDLINSLPDGYQTRLGEKGRGISAGERQRIGIARTLLMDRDIILMDEPTSNLDSFNERKILDTIFSVFKNKTILVVSHRPTLLKHTDRVIHLKDVNARIERNRD